MIIYQVVECDSDSDFTRNLGTFTKMKNAFACAVNAECEIIMEQAKHALDDMKKHRLHGFTIAAMDKRLEELDRMHEKELQDYMKSVECNLIIIKQETDTESCGEVVWKSQYFRKDD